MSENRRDKMPFSASAATRIRSEALAGVSSVAALAVTALR